jgi:hypothetical protein
MTINTKVAKRARFILESAEREATLIAIADKIATLMGAPTPHGYPVVGYSISNTLNGISLHFQGYSEPGYETPRSGIIALGNWNTIDYYAGVVHGRLPISNLPRRIEKLFTKMNIECEWSDEWVVCDECYGLVRTSPDSYLWMRSYWANDEKGEIICHRCLKEDPSEYLEYLKANPRDCLVNIPIDLSQFGYNKLEEVFETGLHPGQTDDPKKVAAKLEGKGITDYIFKMDEVGQFDQRWSVWVRMESTHEDE